MLLTRQTRFHTEVSFSSILMTDKTNRKIFGPEQPLDTKGEQIIFLLNTRIKSVVHCASNVVYAEAEVFHEYENFGTGEVWFGKIRNKGIQPL